MESRQFALINIEIWLRSLHRKRFAAEHISAPSTTSADLGMCISLWVGSSSRPRVLSEIAGSFVEPRPI